jgi:Double zinc ribbon
MTMKKRRKSKIDPNHHQTQAVLRTVGPVVLGFGLMFTAVGFVSFFQSFSTFDLGPPRYFWCLFVGMPLNFIGSVLCKLGYLGAVSRYVAGEFAPVQRDTFNVLARGTRPGVETLARAVGQGFAAGAGAAAGTDRSVPCPQCDASNDASDRFCGQCGAAIETKRCASCGRTNAPDDRFCGQCGERLA